MISTFAKQHIFPGCVLIFLLSFASFGQDIELKPVSKTYVLHNVNVVTSPGTQVSNTTVLIKDGLIHAVGQNIAVPVDAIPVEADSMMVYAGFIDGLSNTGIKKPENDNDRRDIDRANPPNELAGITPGQSIRNGLDPSEKSVEAMRKLGFTMAHVVPYGGMLPGTGGIILLTGDETDDMIYMDNVSFFSKLEGARRMYPSTVMGVMAKYRELYRNAELTDRNNTLYASSPTGMQRPSSDRVLQSFIPVIKGTLPVMFQAEDVKTIQRVLTLQDELGFRLMLGNVKQGWDMTQELKSEGIPLFLSLDLPEWKEDKEDSTEEEVSEEKKMLEERKQEMLMNHYTLASTFNAAGINFGFSAMNAKPNEIHKVLVKMKEKGVSEDILLAGLTTGPANLLGLSRVTGTVEPGKLANLVVTDGNYFDEGAKVRYVFVEGKKYEYEAKPAKSNDSAESEGPEGTWSYSAQTPNGTGTGKIVIRKEGSDLVGEIKDDQTGNSFDLSEILVDGNVMTFEFNYDDGMNQLPLSVEVNIDGKTFSGMIDGGSIGKFPIEGQKDPQN